MNEISLQSLTLNDKPATLGASLGARLAVFVYGVACYALFFGTFLVSFGFVANLTVPGLDRLPAEGVGEGLGLPASIGLDLLLLSLFAVQHSVMARPWFKARLTRYIPEAAERSTYVLLSSLALLLLVALWQPLGGVVWDIQSSAGRTVLTTLMAAGWLLVLAATFMINHFDLFGLRQVWLFLRDRSYTHLPFKEPGLYARIRHPLYLGWFIGFWATPTMSGAHLLFAAVTTVYILAAIRWEERDLLNALGPRYADYRRRVPMFLPRLRRATTKETV
jgi:protein-S-isoprenylcysteine O-methyltransferase Ste14